MWESPNSVYPQQGIVGTYGATVSRKSFETEHLRVLASTVYSCLGHAFWKCVVNIFSCTR